MSLKIGNLVLTVPIIQGGMGVGVSLSGLASAVANEGGVGVISSAGLGLLHRNLADSFQLSCIEGLKKELRAAREKTKGIIGVNIMVAMTNFVDMVKTAIAEKADIIFSGAGLPTDLPSFLPKNSHTKLVPIISSVRALKIIVERWKNNYDYLPDAIVVEGPKAGGHLGYKESQLDDRQFSLETTVAEVVKEVHIYEEKYNRTIPIFAGGGVYNGEDIDRMIHLGASGVQMATRFVTTDECDADVTFKNAYINAKEGDIEIIKSPVGMPGRAIFNDFIKRIKEGKTQPKSCPFHCIKTCDITQSPYCIMLALYNAFKGNLDKGYAFAGTNAWRAEKIISVKETVRNIMDELKEARKGYIRQT
ncbi:MAG: Inosine-5'-monophosphate dehydrogenase [Candidatus Ordinivivax streblomastigis]|uniref:Inosine-5'-monophosphate dehydrogenase n=1 Tax=Candidatus Ordinivivax streblomastigis TaxID=2540710 RepID=A0A5M8P191_9BACT|nr:MAG: Inosine-5'-monophosphate dehydrogenase [Candidatus Ordinivivax streblomastigis]